MGIVAAECGGMLEFNLICRELMAPW